MKKFNKTYGMLTVALGAAVCLSAQPPDFTPPTPLFGAVLGNDTAGVKRLLDEGANPNEGQFLGFKPVFFSVIYQNLESLQLMVKHGADIQAKDRDGSTTLMWAAFNETGRTELLEELLK